MRFEKNYQRERVYFGLEQPGSSCYSLSLNIYFHFLLKFLVNLSCCVDSLNKFIKLFLPANS